MVKPKQSYQSYDVDAELWEDMTSFIPGPEMEEAVFADEKQVREENIRVLKERLKERYEETIQSGFQCSVRLSISIRKDCVRK